MKGKILLSVLMLLAAGQSAQLKAGESRLLLPETSLIDVPTAGMLDYYGFMVRLRHYSGGGLMGSFTAGVMERLSVGLSAAADQLVGSASPVRFRTPELSVRYRFYDGNYYWPAFAAGYDGQGYLYAQDSGKYLQKGRGIYLTASRETGFPGLFLHGGLNMSDFESNYLFGFAGASYNLEERCVLMAEYDNLFHADSKSRLNAGVRLYVAPHLRIDLAGRGIGNGGRHRLERISQIIYSANF